MRKLNFHKLIAVFFVIALIAVLSSACTVLGSGCILRDIIYDNDEETKDDKVKNFYTFEENNTLEVIVSENEKFILYFPANETYIHEQTGEPWHSGYGEWIKDGVAIPVSVMEEPEDNGHIFFKANFENYEYRGLWVYYNAEYAEYFKCEESLPDPLASATGCPIAMIINDSNNPTMKRWDSPGASSTHGDWEDEIITVACSTYSRSGNDKWNYVDDDYWSFTHWEENEEVIYSCEKWNFSFNAKTGIGEWNVNGTTVPIMITFKKREYLMQIYNTDTGDRILSAV